MTDSLAAGREEKLINSGVHLAKSTLDNSSYLKKKRKKKPLVEIETGSVYVHMQSPCGSQGVCGSLPAGGPCLSR